MQSRHLASVLIMLTCSVVFTPEVSSSTETIDADGSPDDCPDCLTTPPSLEESGIRPTLIYHFNETDGNETGKKMFHWEKKRPQETYKLEGSNRWVEVDPLGIVKVKERWDYEQLEEEKTIDFWVLITVPNISDTGRQRIIIHLEDANDEPPYFTNRPLPMQAVVELDAPVGFPIYILQAEDPDTDHDIRYYMARDLTGGRFEVDEFSGEVRTLGSDPFIENIEYVIYVLAEDRNGVTQDLQSTEELKLSIIGGARPPQFYQQNYEATLPENFNRSAEILKVRAKSFANQDVFYTLRARGKGAGTFNIGPSSGRVQLGMKLDYENPRLPKTYFLIVTATDSSSRLSTEVELTIHVTNVNDNAPRFEMHVYRVVINEDIPVGTAILQVSATDIDENENSPIRYSLDTDDFSIDGEGIIYAQKRLDADYPFARYVLAVRATDGGDPPLTGTATVHVYPNNTNDESPKFSRDVYRASLEANAGPGTLVTAVSASDLDGDFVLYGFEDGTVSGMFEIEERTGVIRLGRGPIQLDKVEFWLNVRATDNSSLYRNNKTHTSWAMVIVTITDVNSSPVFVDCDTYAPQIKEGAPNATHVIEVRAVDYDSGYNGLVMYSILQEQEEKVFNVNRYGSPIRFTGNIQTNKVFDREGGDARFVNVTVKATDGGSPPLEDFCSFRVEIIDINDNSPLFEYREYRANVNEKATAGTNILRVSASDKDDGDNGAIVYQLNDPYNSTQLDYFEINADTGWISLKKTIDNDRYQLRALALDKGHPPNTAMADVIIDAVNSNSSLPVWDQAAYGPIFIKENSEIGQIFAVMAARSGIPGNPTIFYSLLKGNMEETNKNDTFYLSQKNLGRHTWANIHLNYPLDYERLQQYNLTVRVENNGANQMTSEATISVIVEDENDEIPFFTETEPLEVFENEPANTKVGRVHALDNDGTYPNNKVYYVIQSTNDGDKFFAIDFETGEIYSKVKFDREEKESYTVLVRADDGIPSDRADRKPGEPNSVTKSIRIAIRDRNDNPPYFDQTLYEAQVNENEEVGYIVITVTAKDKDISSKIRYEITQGNAGGCFGVNGTTGEVYVAQKPDYESRKEFQLRLSASDNRNENFTTVLIRIVDLNDNPPQFDRPVYEIQITEEDNRNLPKRILQVRASDRDWSRKQDIRYSLSGDGTDDEKLANRKFTINSISAEIYVMKPLDRDLPNGRPIWRFMVFATDEFGQGLTDYAYVFVELVDINDNAPSFSDGSYTCNVSENDIAGRIVTTVTAIDYDDPNVRNNARVKYSIERNRVNEKGEMMFRIDSDTGVVSTAVCCLDRETQPEYTILIKATDGGGLSGTVTVTVKITDVNDVPPEFAKKEWLVEVDETRGDTIPRNAVLVVAVNDGDLPETNRLRYEMIGVDFGSDQFKMVTNSDGTGSLKLTKPLDFEDELQRYGFNFTIQVDDGGGNSTDSPHIDQTLVYVRLRDINDNSPEFVETNIEATVAEDLDVGSSLATFIATDADEGGMSRVSYTIDGSSDKLRQFRIDQNGVVSLQRTLDREETSRYDIKILAIDSGTPPQTATATLTVEVGDVNDNAPRFLKDYRPVVIENSPPGYVLEIMATDDDDHCKGNGPPFTFRLDPHASDLIRQSFHVQHIPARADSDGTAIVRSKVSFDRELRKEYLVPILITDSGTPSMTGTGTLTIIIGDVNDNRMEAGNKSIFVYKYEGESLPISIGRVYVEDPDDWDLSDKVFHWKDRNPKFDVDRATGLISMRNGTGCGTYFLTFTVLDNTQETSANVSVTVKVISEEAIFNSGSIRISGITDEDFIREWDSEGNYSQAKSKFHKLQEIIANLTESQEGNVDIFSVILKQERPSVTDVQFAVRNASGSYFQANLLNGVIDLNRELIETEVGINITMVGIDECLFENINCKSSCTDLLVLDRHPILVDANQTSLTGVNARQEPTCVCGTRESSETETCKENPPTCYNGGKCSESINGVKCKCRDDYGGPRCELTTRSFDGNGWAWFDPLQQCDNSHLSLEFMTLKADGLLLYNGPISEPGTAQDFISLELQSGRPRLLIDFGSGTAEAVVDVDKSLDDGEWHTVDVVWDRESVRVVVDNCQMYKIEDSIPSEINRSGCEVKTNIPPFNEFLNVNTPLQLGGVHHPHLTKFQWQHQHTRKGFDGCIKNVVYNGKMYDLGNPGNSAASSPGCKPAENICRTDNITRHCSHGTCLGTFNSAKCVCHPGYYGTLCDKEAVSKTFEQNSYITYSLSFHPDPYRTEIQLQFRTRQKQGELIRATGNYSRQYCILEIVDEKLRFRFNLKQAWLVEEYELWLPNVQVSDGEWHTVLVLRYGSTAFIWLDGGGGRRYSELLEYEGKHQLMMGDKRNVTVGGNVLYRGARVVSIGNDFKGCIRDIRFDQRYLPMDRSSSRAVTLKKKNVTDKCPSNPCLYIICPNPSYAAEISVYCMNADVHWDCSGFL